MFERIWIIYRIISKIKSELEIQDQFYIQYCLQSLVYNKKPKRTNMDSQQYSQNMVQIVPKCASESDLDLFFKKKSQNNLSPIENYVEPNQSFPPTKQKRRVQSENWQLKEIRKLFLLHTQYGSQWKIIKTQFPDRSSNSIKNRFYTVIRILLKKLFRQLPILQNKLPHQISSKSILRLYQGKQGTFSDYEEFYKLRGFVKKILKIIDYNVESGQVKRIFQTYPEQIKAIYELIFFQKANNEKSKSKKQQTKKKEQKLSQMPTKNSIQPEVEQEKMVQQRLDISSENRIEQQRPNSGGEDIPMMGSMILIPFVPQNNLPSANNNGIHYHYYFI